MNLLCCDQSISGRDKVSMNANGTATQLGIETRRSNQPVVRFL
jgi:hypothetical protein